MRIMLSVERIVELLKHYLELVDAGSAAKAAVFAENCAHIHLRDGTSFGQLIVAAHAFRTHLRREHQQGGGP